MFKLLRFTCVSICIVAVFGLLSFSVLDNSPTEIDTRNHHFPVLLTGDIQGSTLKYARATLKLQESILSRQRAIKLVMDSVPQLSDLSKSEQTEDPELTVYKLSPDMIYYLIKKSHYIDSLYVSGAFFGNDTEASVRKAKSLAEAKKKIADEKNLPKASRDREALYAGAKVNSEALLNKVSSDLKDQLPRLVQENDAVFINENRFPVFADTMLLTRFSELEKPFQISRLVFKVLALKTAYPDDFKALNEDFLNLVEKKKWFELFDYLQEKANPLEEQNYQYLQKHKKVFGV